MVPACAELGSKRASRQPAQRDPDLAALELEVMAHYAPPHRLTERAPEQ